MFNITVGSACRFKVIGWPKRKFESPREAEVHYSIGGNRHSSVQIDLTLLHHPGDVASSTCATICNGVQTDFSRQQLSSDSSIEYLSSIFAQVCDKEVGMKTPKNFIGLANSALLHLS